ncbi:uncharacterized protein Fot_37580 [Forsythia ovata]|uniref:Uncharacterized protein n=1 Tax=Forsythia ovata TaxID=205694 RepID=A0ABD1S1J7_9LAMI
MVGDIQKLRQQIMATTNIFSKYSLICSSRHKQYTYTTTTNSAVASRSGWFTLPRLKHRNGWKKSCTIFTPTNRRHSLKKNTTHTRLENDEHLHFKRALYRAFTEGQSNMNEANEKYSDELRSLDCDDPIRAKKNKDLIFITMISVIHILKQVQQGREPTDVDFCSIAIDGGLENDILQQRLHTVLKQREQLQHMEIGLRAQEQLHKRGQQIHELERKIEEKERELNAIILDNEDAWAKEDLLREQSKELQSYSNPNDSTLDGSLFVANKIRDAKKRLAVKREATDDDLKVIQMLHAMTMGAEVLPSDAADSWPEGELTYIRAYFERMTRSKDLETCYMMNPDGNSGPELNKLAI